MRAQRLLWSQETNTGEAVDEEIQDNVIVHGQVVDSWVTVSTQAYFQRWSEDVPRESEMMRKLCHPAREEKGLTLGKRGKQLNEGKCTVNRRS